MLQTTRIIGIDNNNGAHFSFVSMASSAAQFYLASASPRRRELLRRVGLSFETIPVDIEEKCGDSECAVDFVARMAVEKAARAANLIKSAERPGLPVLAADTCICFAGRIMGKPTDKHHARKMLRALSGHTHEVCTAIALNWNEQIWRDLSVSRVTFGSLSEVEIKSYCDSEEPLDKAGAYAIQGMGSAFVKHLEGSYTGVVGLPMYETRRLLAKSGIDWL